MTGEGLGGTPKTGSTIGPWTLHEPLGSGGIAAVYRATRADGTTAAIKILHPTSVGTDEVRRFKREYQTLQRVEHPNVVQVFEAGVRQGYPWIAMEFVEGTDLDQAVRAWANDDPTDRWARVERVLRGLCAGLGCVHDLGLVHRDIKPSNVLLTADGEPKLGDFGVVKDSRAQTTALTMHGNLVGTVAFMSPEHIMDEEVDARSDLYSLGAVLYVMLTGRRPIEAKSVTGFLARHLSHVPTPPSDLRPDVPRRLESVCQRLLYKDKNQRFPTANAVLSALDEGGDPDLEPLRGREPIEGRWQERLTALSQGAGGVVAVVGEPWSGRSFTLRHLVERCPVPAALVSGQSRNPVTGLARALGANVDETPKARHLRLLADVVRAQPTVLAIDDLDAAEPRMITAIARLMRKVVAQEGAPVLLLYTAGDPVSERIADVHEALVTTLPPAVWELGPIPRKAISTLLRDLGLKGAMVGVLTRRLAAELHGRPAAIHEQVVALLQADWLVRDEARLRPRHNPEHFARAALPVPSRARTHLDRLLGQLDPESLALAEVLAVLGRPGEIRLLVAVADCPASSVDLLTEARLTHRHTTPDADTLGLALPWARDVIAGRLSPTRRRALHLAIAQLLGSRRRRAAAEEVAHHFEAAGSPERAWPLFLRAARNAARNKDSGKVLSLSQRARRVEGAGMAAVEPARAHTLRLQGRQLEGDAYLVRGQWLEAVQPLQEAVADARALADPKALSLALQAVGRAWYRLGRFAEAKPPLVEALRQREVGMGERAPALRALADIRLRENRFDQAETLWNEALSTARTADSADAEARALRGLAHLRALEGRLESAADALDRADDLLRGSRTPRVHAGVLARSVELDLAAGRYDRALSRAASLADLVERKELEDRTVEAGILQALAQYRAGDREGAARTSNQVAAFSRAAHWTTRLHVARLRCVLGAHEELDRILPARDELPDDPLEDAPAQAAAIRARAASAEQPARARDLARWCLVRPSPRLILRHADILLDAGEALLQSGDGEGAREAAKVGLRNLSGPGADGLRLELLSLFHRADPDPRILAAFRQVASRVCRTQPPSIISGLRTRPGMGPALP